MTSTGPLFDDDERGEERKPRPATGALKTPEDIAAASERIVQAGLTGHVPGGEVRALVAALDQHAQLLRDGAGAARALERLRERFGLLVDLQSGKIDNTGTAYSDEDVADALKDGAADLRLFEDETDEHERRNVEWSRTDLAELLRTAGRTEEAEEVAARAAEDEAQCEDIADVPDPFSHPQNLRTAAEVADDPQTDDEAENDDGEENVIPPPPTETREERILRINKEARRPRDDTGGD